MRKRAVVAGLAGLLGVIVGPSGCGSAGHPQAPGRANLPARGLGTSATTTGTIPATSSDWMQLPMGAETSYVFGSTTSTTDGGGTLSNLPPNTDDVDQARVDAAPLLAPINFSLTDAKRWPSLCSLTNVAQLRALEPSILGLRGTVPVTQHPISCTFNLTTTFDTAESARIPTFVEIVIDEVATTGYADYVGSLRGPANGDEDKPDAYVDYGNLGNGLSCYGDDGESVSCDKGLVEFEITGEKNTDGDLPDADNAVWVDQIDLPLAEVLGRELTGT